MQKNQNPVEDLRRPDLTSQVIGLAIEVHRHLGPGLLESAYEECLCHELRQAKIDFVRQQKLPVRYKGIQLNIRYTMDKVVDGSLASK